MISVVTLGPHAKKTHLIGCGRKGVNIGLFPNKVEYQLFRCHVTNVFPWALANGTCSKDLGKVSYLHDPEVSNTCSTLPCDQNVPLGGKLPLA